MEFSLSELVWWKSCLWDDKTSPTTGTFAQKFPQTATKVGAKKYLTWLLRNSCWNVSSRPTGLFCRFCQNDCLRFFSCCHYPSVFLAGLPTLFCNSLEIFFTATDFWNFLSSIYHQVNTHLSSSWNNTFWHKSNFDPPKSTCRCTKSFSTLSINTPIEWNLYLFWSNHRETYHSSGMNVGGFSPTSKLNEWGLQRQNVFFSPQVSLK